MLTANKQTSTSTDTLVQGDRQSFGFSSLRELLNKLIPAKDDRPASKVERSSQSYAMVMRREHIDLLTELAPETPKRTIQCASALIGNFAHWREWKLKAQRTEWIYQSIQNIYKDLMETFSKHVIRRAIALLIELGLVERRTTPNNYQDKTYQYKLNLDRIKILLERLKSPTPETTAQSPFVQLEHSVFNVEHREFNAEQHTQYPSSKVIYTSIDVDNDFEEKEADQEKVVVTQEVTKVIQDEFKEEIVTTNENSVEDQFSAAAPSQKFIEETREKLKQFIGGFAPVQDAKATKQGIKIEGADEETLEVLWRHEERLQELNVDLSTDRIRQAIVNNPQFLENAIHAFYEASAKGKLTSKEANGYFYNALKQGWKPKQSTSNSSPSIFTAPPEFFEPIVQPTLAELVERKRQMWKTEALRPSITAWTEKTEGVILTADGPALSF